MEQQPEYSSKTSIKLAKAHASEKGVFLYKKVTSSKMYKNLSVLFLVSIFAIPSVSVEAKGNNPRGFTKDKGSEIAVTDPIEWPIRVSGSSKLRGTVESLPGMAVIRVQAYTPWYAVFSEVPATTTLFIKGLPAKTKVQVYTDGYRDHNEVETTSGGNLNIRTATGRGMQVIIKSTPSTIHIQRGGFLNPAGGDCSSIGTWNATTNTCTLTRDITESIVIEDAGITLDGNNKSVTGAGSGDGVYTDQGNVTIKNVNVSGFARGVVFSDSFSSLLPSEGSFLNSTVENNTRNFVNEGIPDISLNTITAHEGSVGLHIVDQTDGIATDGLTVAGSTVQNNTTGVYLNDVSVTFTNNNFIGNDADFSRTGGTLTLSSDTSGNFWSTFACEQDPTTPNKCTNDNPRGGSTDANPWACKDAWRTDVTCPDGEGNPQPPSLTTTPEIAESIANAKNLLGAPYQWGAKGYDYDSRTFTSPLKIVSAGYRFYDKDLNSGKGGTRVGAGVDCSGLAAWSYNKVQYGNSEIAYGKCFVTGSNPGTCVIAYQGAQGQADHNIDQITKDQLRPGDLLFFDTAFGGVGIDHMAIYTGESPYNVIHANDHSHSVALAKYDQVTNKVTTLNSANEPSILTVTKIGRITNARIELVINTESPVYLVVTDPEGFTSSPDKPWDGPMEYQVGDLNSTGELHDIVLTGKRKFGDYSIKVFPKSDALLTDTYSIVARAKINGEWKIIDVTRNVRVADIPAKPYVISSSLEDLVVRRAIKTNEEKVAVCHFPSGDLANRHVVTVGKSAVSAHLAHGDYLGECTAVASSTSKVKGKKK